MNVAIMLSGGIGTRVGGDIPKQYLEINGKRIIYYSLDTMAKSEWINKICIVASKEWQKTIMEEIDDAAKQKIIGFAEPGENRQLSILNGMEFIKSYYEDVSDCDAVFIHDAARPYLTEEMIEKYISAIENHDGVLPVLPMKDTVYISEDGNSISSLIDRKKIFAGQAPEVFRFGKYYKANKALLPDRIKLINGSTEPAVMAGMDVVMVPGEEKNVKVTTINDIKGGLFCE